ncbi:MAG TPA: hypothetical protein VJ992_12625 [Gemmatimonadales bacterium]|nr:hypothetical protein [Gemmatimonadales bacterium]
MNRISLKELVLSGVALAAAAISPNLFWIAQAGYAKLSTLAVWVLIPSIVVVFAVLWIAGKSGERRLVNRMIAGGLAGGLATIALEVVRITGFHLGQMPGSMPELAGVLLLNRFMLGPSLLSNIAGWSYHFSNGITFGMIYAVIFGRKPLWVALGYGLFMAAGFLVSPAVTALGIGFMGHQMPGMPVTVVLAHLGYATVLWALVRRWVDEPEWILGRRDGHRAATR